MTHSILTPQRKIVARTRAICSTRLGVAHLSPKCKAGQIEGLGSRTHFVVEAVTSGSEIQVVKHAMGEEIRMLT